MGAPQIVMIVIISIGLGNSLCNHGNVKEEKYNFWTTLVAIAIEVALLKWGGFFG